MSLFPSRHLTMCARSMCAVFPGGTGAVVRHGYRDGIHEREVAKRSLMVLVLPGHGFCSKGEIRFCIPNGSRF